MSLKQLLIISGLILLGACAHNKKQYESFDIYNLTKEEINLLKEGDIILRQGYGFVSNTIVKTLGEAYPFSHAGILVLNAQNEFTVIHSVSQSLSDFDGVQQASLKKFVRDSKPGSVVVVRFKPAANDTVTSTYISQKAWEFLEMKVPFDHSFDFENHSAMFCTELIVKILDQVFGEVVYDQIYPKGLSGLEGLKFGGFVNPDYFQIIIDHQKGAVINSCNSSEYN